MNYINLLVIYFGIYAILSLSLNLIAGYTGLLSLCHAAFYGIGAYSTAILLTQTGLNFWIVLLISGILSAVFGIIIGLPTLRLKGDYLAIATLGFGQIIKNILVNWDSLTRGPRGINNIPSPSILSFTFDPRQKWHYIILIWVFVIITFFILNRIIRSRFGRALNAIREDEIAAKSMGIDTTKYKVIAFSIGAFFAGLAGSLWAVYNQSVTPEDFNFMLSIMILCMVVLGGMGNQLAVILGSIIIVLASELPRLTGLSRVIPAQTNQIIFGLILVIMMIYRPDGILGRKRINFGDLIKSSIKKKED